VLAREEPAVAKPSPSPTVDQPGICPSHATPAMQAFEAWSAQIKHLLLAPAAAPEGHISCTPCQRQVQSWLRLPHIETTEWYQASISCLLSCLGKGPIYLEPRDNPTVKERKSVGLGCMDGKTMFLNSILFRCYWSFCPCFDHTHTTLVA
jgi:hypothetical protein